MTEETPEGVPLRSRWHVTLTIDNRPYDAEVVIDQDTDSVEVKRSHKPLGMLFPVAQEALASLRAIEHVHRLDVGGVLLA